MKKQFTAIAEYGDFIKEPFTEEDLNNYCKDGYILEVGDIVYELVPKFKVKHKENQFNKFDLERYEEKEDTAKV